MSIINIRTIRKVFSELGFREEEGNFIKDHFTYKTSDIKSFGFQNAKELQDYLEKSELPFDIQIESDQAVFIDESIRNIYTPIIKRIDAKGVRLYYTNEIGYEIFCSGTNFVAMGLPDDMSRIMKWRDELRKKGIDPDEEVDYLASFGTIMHVLFGNLSMGKAIPGDTKRLAEYIRKLPIKRINKDHVERLIEKDLWEMVECMESWVFFCKERNVKVYFIEKMMRSTSMPVATAQDFYVEMDFFETYEENVYYKKSGSWGEAGTLRRIDEKKKTVRYFTLLDLKSGDHSYEKHFYQLDSNRTMMQETYGDLCPVQKIVNFHPLLGKKKNGEPKYLLVDWQKKPNYDYLMARREHIYALSKMDFERKKFYIEEEEPFEFKIGEYVDSSTKKKKTNIIDFLIKNEL